MKQNDGGEDGGEDGGGEGRGGERYYISMYMWTSRVLLHLMPSFCFMFYRLVGHLPIDVDSKSATSRHRSQVGNGDQVDAQLGQQKQARAKATATCSTRRNRAWIHCSGRHHVERHRLFSGANSTDSALDPTRDRAFRINVDRQMADQPVEHEAE